MLRKRKQGGPVRPPSAAKTPPARNATPDTRTAPDPLTIVLPAISGLAAIASIATIHWSAEDESEPRQRSRRKAQAALRDLETCCMGLSEIFKRFQKLPRVFAGEGPPAAMPLKFGTHTPRVSADDARLLHKLASDVASMLVLANQNAFDVMSVIEDGEIAAPEDVFFGFADCQEKLNLVILERATLRASVEIGADVSARLITLVRELKSHLVED